MINGSQKSGQFRARLGCSRGRQGAPGSYKGKLGATRGRKATGLVVLAQSAGLQETEKMSYWDGDRWVDADASPTIASSRRANWAATAVMLIGLIALVLPFGASFAATRKSAPSLYVGCNTACVVGGSLAVRGTGFTPSSGGQQVMLWVEYPADYCAGSTCHGFYYNPWVNDDGTFSHTFDSAILQAGTGGVEAIQYNARTDKWVKVAYVDYSTR